MGGIHHTGLIDPAFGRRLAAIRRAQGVTQLRLAADAGCAVRSIQQIEYGRLSPTLTFARRLALVLGVEFRCEFVEAAEATNGQRRPATSAARLAIDRDSIREGEQGIHRVGARE